MKKYVLFLKFQSDEKQINKFKWFKRLLTETISEKHHSYKISIMWKVIVTLIISNNIPYQTFYSPKTRPNLILIDYSLVAKYPKAERFKFHRSHSKTKLDISRLPIALLYHWLLIKSSLLLPMPGGTGGKKLP